LFREGNCDTDQYLVVAEVRKRLAVDKQTCRLGLERFNPKKLHEIRGKEQHVEISNRFRTLETKKLS
jgi:hypothetical protein